MFIFFVRIWYTPPCLQLLSWVSPHADSAYGVRRFIDTERPRFIGKLRVLIACRAASGLVLLSCSLIAGITVKLAIAIKPEENRSPDVGRRYIAARAK